MSEISKAYEPQSVEDKWYQLWLEGKFFTADPKSPKPAYSIVIPPPNVTGVLTMGHVLNNTIQDILARKARMPAREIMILAIALGHPALLEHHCEELAATEFAGLGLGPFRDALLVGLAQTLALVPGVSRS